MGARFLDRFRAVVLDMGDTFMFGCDRFGANDGLADSYRELGGATLSAGAVGQIVAALLEVMLADARSGDFDDSFASVAEQLARLPATRGLPPAERACIEALIARHEAGRIPESHAHALQELRRRHPLGLISNVWSRSDVFEAELKRAGVFELFDVRVWSSEHGSIKPSPRLFEHALAALGVRPHEAVFVGDHPQRDVAAARAVGMGTVLVRSARPLRAGDPQPDRTVDSIEELLAED